MTAGDILFSLMLFSIVILAFFQFAKIYNNRFKKKEKISAFEAIEIMVSQEKLSPEDAAEISASLKEARVAFEDRSDSSRLSDLWMRYDSQKSPLANIVHSIVLFRDNLIRENITYNRNIRRNRLKQKYLSRYESITPTAQIEKHLLKKGKKE